jgi:hypothetical protein
MEKFHQLEYTKPPRTALERAADDQQITQIASMARLPHTPACCGDRIGICHSADGL